jgi:signal transduction histidine kinase
MLGRVVGENVRIATSLDPRLWAVDADPSQLEQVIFNIVLNARDAMPDGGTLSISTSLITLDEAGAVERGVEAGPYLVISVADTGVGISPDFAPHIFELFRQADPPAGHVRGLGIGLSIVSQIVALHKGSVRVESGGIGRGATFIVKLPLAGATPAQPKELS